MKRLLILGASILSMLLASEYAEATNTEQLIIKYAIKYKLNPKLLKAIFQQESSLGIKMYNKHSKDYGIGQINIKNVKLRKLDKDKLVTNIAYSIEQSAIMLAELRNKYAKSDKNWWTRYHSFTPQKRIVYQLKVERHMQIRKLAGAQ